MAIFPTGVVTTATLISVVPTNPTNNPSHAGQHDNINGEIIAIETALGAGVTNVYATVTAALTTLGTLASTAQNTANVALAAANSAQTTATAAIPKSAFTGNGALLAGTATSGSYTVVAVPGTTGYVLTANTASSGGMGWAAAVNTITAYPGAGIAVSSGTNATAWSGSYSVGTATGNIIQLNSSNQIPAGISGALLSNVIGSVVSYGATTATAGAISLANLKIAYGYTGNSASSYTISGLTFTSSTSYSVVASILTGADGGNQPGFTLNSGTSFTIYLDGSHAYNWIAIGT